MMWVVVVTVALASAAPARAAQAELDRFASVNLPSFEDRLEAAEADALAMVHGQARDEASATVAHVRAWLAEARALTTARRTPAQDFQLSCLLMAVRGALNGGAGR